MLKVDADSLTITDLDESGWDIEHYFSVRDRAVAEAMAQADAQRLENILSVDRENLRFLAAQRDHLGQCLGNAVRLQAYDTLNKSE